MKCSFQARRGFTWPRPRSAGHPTAPGSRHRFEATDQSCPAHVRNATRTELDRPFNPDFTMRQPAVSFHPARVFLLRFHLRGSSDVLIGVIEKTKDVQSAILKRLQPHSLPQEYGLARLCCHHVAACAILRRHHDARLALLEFDRLRAELGTLNGIGSASQYQDPIFWL